MDADVRQVILDLREYSNRLAPGDGEEIRRLCKKLTEALKEDVCDHSFVGRDRLCRKCGLYFPETCEPVKVT